ncbi:MAG: serine/threonine protein kinase, partial [candidate division Zixibacteria bacterium]|nr:serine/threonine protein kinase [candidate division Zixibacteria bacterium]
MLTIAGYNNLSKIHEGEVSNVYRAGRMSDNQSVILKVLNNSYSHLIERKRYKQNYIISCTLDTDNVVRTFGLEEHQSQMVMILEDFGGESLEKLINTQHAFTIDELLIYTIRITEILGSIHGQNIIHKDINPSNIILNPASGVIKIAGFGICTQLSKQHISLKNTGVLEGTLAYMSPEQTGRMNRDLDYRSDFYSLGATFYELFTGVVPFVTTDALEIVHCHIAKQPTPPIQINPDLPATVSNIILKLLEKTAEGRYQSAWGLKVDLEQCLKQWQKTGKI